MENDENTQDVDLVQENNDTVGDTTENDVQEVDYKAEAAKWKAIAMRKLNKKPQQPLQVNKEPIDDEIVQSVRELKFIEAKRQFGYDNNLSPEETDFIFKFANGKPTKETLENPFVKSGLEGYRSQKRLEQNTPSSTSSSKVFQGKEFSEMTDDERKKAFEEANKKFFK